VTGVGHTSLSSRKHTEWRDHHTNQMWHQRVSPSPILGSARVLCHRHRHRCRRHCRLRSHRRGSRRPRHSREQSTEGVRAPNKRAPSTPTAGDSPVGPRTKTRVVPHPLPPPPPSIPPSPPSPSTPPSPPSSLHPRHARCRAAARHALAAARGRATTSLHLPFPTIPPTKAVDTCLSPRVSNQSEAGACSHALVGLVACTGDSSLVL
jgi:hypothetical protein